MLRISRFVPLLLLSLLPACSLSRVSKESATAAGSAHRAVFDQVADMPFDQVIQTDRDLNRDAVRWKRTLSQISISDNEAAAFPLDG
jgi:hypothetical protein